MTLKDLAKAIQAKKYANIPEHARPALRFSDKSANDLTKAIVAYFEDFKGIKAWRQASEGRYIQGRSFKNEWSGRTQQEKGMYIPRNKAAKGAADITVTLPPYGRRLEIEVKFGEDRQSKAQKIFQQEIEAMGALYMIVKTWDDFIVKVNSIDGFKQQKP